MQLPNSSFYFLREGIQPLRCDWFEVHLFLGKCHRHKVQIKRYTWLYNDFINNAVEVALDCRNYFMIHFYDNSNEKLKENRRVGEGYLSSTKDIS